MTKKKEVQDQVQATTKYCGHAKGKVVCLN
jgi:hypothetical protein